jgi:hypothetical protein
LHTASPRKHQRHPAQFVSAAKWAGVDPTKQSWTRRTAPVTNYQAKRKSSLRFAGVINTVKWDDPGQNEIFTFVSIKSGGYSGARARDPLRMIPDPETDSILSSHGLSQRDEITLGGNTSSMCGEK